MRKGGSPENMMIKATIFCAVLALATAGDDTGISAIVPIFPPSCAALTCAPGYVCRVLWNPRTRTFQARCQRRRPKPGRCPIARGRSLGRNYPCPWTCSSDYDCKGTDKCCPTYCGGRTCSPVRPSCLGVRCPPGQRCVLRQVYCFTTPCYPQPTCVPIVKRGVCPSPFSRGQLTSRRACRSGSRRCRTDADCPGVLKCCPFCGGRRTCVYPQPRSTCANVRCASGYVCIMVQPICKRPPCFRVPRCVKRDPPGCSPVALSAGSALRSRCGRPGDMCSLYKPRSCPRGRVCCPTICGNRCFLPRRG